MADDFLTLPLGRLLGPRTQETLEKGLGIRTVGQLLHHYPRRYTRRGAVVPIAEIEEGDEVTVEATVVRSTSRDMRNRRGSVQEVIVRDAAGSELSLTFFHQPWRVRHLRVGRRGFFSGEVGAWEKKAKVNGRWVPVDHVIQLVHPVMLLFGTAEDADAVRDDFVDEVVPIYPATKAVDTWAILTAVRALLDLTRDLPDPLPEAVRRRHRLMSLTEALHTIHRPDDLAAAERAKDRLRFDEAFVLQAALAQRRFSHRALRATPRVARPDGLLAAFDATLPFVLTKGQVEVGAEIEADLARSYPMHRLLQGEVGSGKTLVALRAMLSVVDAGGQAALLAPTEVLAQQHHRSLLALLGPLGRAGELGAAERATRIALLTGSMGAAARRRAMLDAQSGDAGIVVGTHALLEEKVGFADLGLVVVDEQHRFGVEQRDALRAKGERPPHLLVMTATPIPRTVAMTVFGDLDVSTLTELPAGRASITTHVVPVAEKPHYLERAWSRIREEVAQGRQAYVVCPRIGEDPDAVPEPKRPKKSSRDDEVWDDEAGAYVPLLSPLDDETKTEDGRPPLAVVDVLPMLEAGPLAGLRVEPLHGRLPPEQKEHTMLRFSAGEIDVLVATTVVEVGVDVPNATVMAIMDADRFGVSQLHQLRGRVGRGAAPGLCLLITDARKGSPAERRLGAVAATSDGFELARLDLDRRHEGDVLGTAQSGRQSSLKLLGVIRDEDLIRDAREAATEVVEADPDLTAHPALAAALRVLLDPERAEFLEKA